MKKLRSDYVLFLSSSVENRRLLRQEELILNVTEALSERLEESGIAKSELADRLGKSRGFVSQLFAGGRNLTLRTVADLADALDSCVFVEVVALSPKTVMHIGGFLDVASWHGDERPQVKTVAAPLPFRHHAEFHEGAA